MTGTTSHHYLDAGDGLTLHVEVSGGGPPLVLLHGFTGSVATWSAIRPELDAYTVVAVDLPGHGRSSAPPDPSRYGLDRFADDLTRVLDALAIGRAAVHGYSMGGRAALKFALAYPERVAALVLESTSAGLADEAERASRREADEELARLVERDGVAAFVDHWEGLTLWASQRRLPAAVRAALRSQRLGASPVGLANSLRGAGVGTDLPVHSRLSEITGPVVLVAGALDTKYVAHALALEAAIGGSRLAIVPDAGHAVHLERPAGLARVVSEFLGNGAFHR